VLRGIPEKPASAFAARLQRNVQLKALRSGPGRSGATREGAAERSPGASDPGRGFGRSPGLLQMPAPVRAGSTACCVCGRDVPPASLNFRRMRSRIHFGSHHSTGLTIWPCTSIVKCR
jgi:hypothetical protein